MKEGEQADSTADDIYLQIGGSIDPDSGWIDGKVWRRASPDEKRMLWEITQAIVGARKQEAAKDEEEKIETDDADMKKDKQAESAGKKEDDFVMIEGGKLLQIEAADFAKEVTWQWQEKTVTRKWGWIDMDEKVCAVINAAMADFKTCADPEARRPIVYYSDHDGGRTWCANLQNMTQTRILGGKQGATSYIRPIRKL